MIFRYNCVIYYIVFIAYYYVKYLMFVKVRIEYLNIITGAKMILEMRK